MDESKYPGFSNHIVMVIIIYGIIIASFYEKQLSREFHNELEDIVSYSVYSHKTTGDKSTVGR